MNTLRTILVLAVLAVCGLHANAARASGDFGCTTAWTLRQTSYADCNNLPFLSPGNDTRVNLQLLLIDAGGADIEPAPKTDPCTPPSADSASPFTWEAFADVIGPRPPGAPDADANSDYAAGEGESLQEQRRRHQGFRGGARRAGPTVPAGERGLLWPSAREALTAKCDDAAAAPPPSAPPGGVNSTIGRLFSEYLAGTAGFYDGDFDAARTHFGALRASSQPWLKETARYMIGRAALNQAQFNAFGDYGLLSADKVDAVALKDADQAFQAYLHDYPKGLYAASARGLLRRLDWLGAQPGGLAAGADWALRPSGRRQAETSRRGRSGRWRPTTSC